MSAKFNDRGLGREFPVLYGGGPAEFQGRRPCGCLPCPGGVDSFPSFILPNPVNSRDALGSAARASDPGGRREGGTRAPHVLLDRASLRPAEPPPLPQHRPPLAPLGGEPAALGAGSDRPLPRQL